VTHVRRSAEVLRTDSEESFEEALVRAAQLLAGGEVVAIPTETVYGLAANALDARAVERIFEAKGRPAHNPIIVHVAGVDMARQCVVEWPAAAEKLARSFWPGPLTLVLRRAQLIPEVVTAGGGTVGVRWPRHRFAQALIQRCGFPLAAPSANLSTQVSPTTAEHVRKQLGDQIPLIIDGGPCQVGIESSVLDLTCRPARLLRPGMIHEGALVAAAGQVAVGQGRETLLRSPGQLPKHYAPRARLVTWPWKDENDLLKRASAAGVNRSRVCVLAHTCIPAPGHFGRVSVLPHDPVAFARAFYAELHACDDAGAELIIVEAVPSGNEWRALGDRLTRAASG
jgi:L-threonylcarbamoyladenylate synthase